MGSSSSGSEEAPATRATAPKRNERLSNRIVNRPSAEERDRCDRSQTDQQSSAGGDARLIGVVGTVVCLARHLDVAWSWAHLGVSMWIGDGGRWTVDGGRGSR